MFFDEVQIGDDVSIGGISGEVAGLIFFLALEFRARKLRTFSADFKTPFLDAAGYEGTGRMLVEEVGATASGTS